MEETQVGSNGDLNMLKIELLDQMFMSISPVASQIFRLKIGIIVKYKNNQVALMTTKKNMVEMDLLLDNLLDRHLLSTIFKILKEVLQLNHNLLEQ